MNDEGVENRLCRWLEMGKEDLDRASHRLEEDYVFLVRLHTKETIQFLPLR